MELDKLFNKYDERKRESAETDEKERLLDERRRKKSLEILRLLVLPVLREVSAAIRFRGHESQVRESTTGPSLELTLSLDRVFISRLIISHDGDALSVTQRVKGEKQPDEYSVNERLPLAAVSEEAVRSRAESFVKAVLEAN